MFESTDTLLVRLSLPAQPGLDHSLVAEVEMAMSGEDVHVLSQNLAFYRLYVAEAAEHMTAIRNGDTSPLRIDGYNLSARGAGLFCERLRVLLARSRRAKADLHPLQQAGLAYL